MHEIRKPSDEKPSHPEKKVFYQELPMLLRQVFAMARIYHAIYENDNRKYDHETGYVLFQELSITEGMPLLLDGINNLEKAAADIEEWNNRTTEIENKTQYRVRLTDDAVLIEISNTRVDTERVSPTVEEDNLADALMDSLDEELDDVEERRKNPLLDYATRVENFGKLLESSTLVLELVPNSNDGEISVRTTQKETPSELGGTAQFRNLRLNMLNELRLLLSEAVEGQAPDHYQQLLTPEVRSAILSMILSELKNKKDLDQPWEEYRVLRAIEGIAFYEFEGYPVAVILDRHQSYRKGLLEVVEKIFRVPLANLLSMAGEQDLDSLNEDEIENLTVESEHILRSNARHVQGRISNLSVDPENESVNYEFVHRSLAGDLNNNREETFLDRYEYPNERGEISCAMLDVLMGLII